MKLKGLTITYIIIGIISIFLFSIFLISNLDFIYYMFANSHFESSLEYKEGFKELVNYVVDGRDLNNLGSFTYNDRGLVYLNNIRSFYFDLKLWMVLFIGSYLMISVLFSKNSLYQYEKIDNHTPYLFTGFITLLIAFAWFIIVIVDVELYTSTLYKFFADTSIKLMEVGNSFVNIVNKDYIVLASLLMLLIVVIIAILFILLDLYILRKERENMNIKLIAIDLDGTLLNDKKVVDERTKNALKLAKEKGIYVVLASGRPIRGMLSLIKELELDTYENYAINFNGAAINKTQDLEAIYNCNLTLEEMLEIEDFAKKHHIHSHAFVNGECYIEENGEYSDVEAKINSIPLHLVKYNDFSKDVIVNKYMFADDPEKLKEIYPLIPESFYQKYTVVFSSPFFLEFLNKETNKGKALEALCSKLNICKDEVMAIGDEENDLSMLEYAGFKVAMGNANKKLKDIATFITDDNNASGVGKVVEKFILNKI